MRDIEICVIVANYVNKIPEGHTTMAINIIDALQTVNVNPTIISVERAKRDRARATTQIPTLPMPYPLLKMAFKYKLYEAVPATVLMFKRLKCDIYLLLNVSHEVFATAIKSGVSSKPIIASSWYPLSPDIESWALRPRLWLNRRFIDKVICTAKYLASYHKEIFGHNKAVYCPPPINTNRFAPTDKLCARRALNLRHETTLIGYIGSLKPTRGIGDLLKAFKILKHKCKDIKLFIATTELPQWSINAMKDDIVLVGPINSVELFYSAMDIIALPFRSPYYMTEPPMVVLEALASGSALVTTPVGAVKELANDDKALLVQPGNVEMLKSAIEYLLDDEGTRTKLGRNARDYATKNLSLEVIGERMKNIFEETI